MIWTIVIIGLVVVMLALAATAKPLCPRTYTIDGEFTGYDCLGKNCSPGCPSREKLRKQQ